MKKLILLIIIFIQTGILYSQSGQYVGINTTQLLANTIHINYIIEKTEKLSYLFEGGVTFNYTKALDYPGWILSSHYDCDDVYAEKINGGYLKAGLLIRSNKSLEKVNYFNYGISLISAVIHEEGTYDDYNENTGNYEEDIPFNQTYIKMGIGIYVRYNLRISERISTNFGIQLSRSIYKSKDCYWDYEFIPGMGLNTHNVDYRIMPVIGISYTIK